MIKDFQNLMWNCIMTLIVSILVTSCVSTTFETSSITQAVMMTDAVGVGDTYLPESAELSGTINGMVAYSKSESWRGHHKVTETITTRDANSLFKEYLYNKSYSCVTDLTFIVENQMVIFGQMQLAKKWSLQYCNL